VYSTVLSSGPPATAYCYSIPRSTNIATPLVLAWRVRYFPAFYQGGFKEKPTFSTGKITNKLKLFKNFSGF
jgi:hypothetical protein